MKLYCASHVKWLVWLLCMLLDNTKETSTCPVHLLGTFYWHGYPCIQAAYKFDLILSANQTFIYQSASNKDFSWTYLDKLLKLSTFPVPKDPHSKVRTFPGKRIHGNLFKLWYFSRKKDPLEPVQTLILCFECYWENMTIYPQFLSIYFRLLGIFWANMTSVILLNSIVSSTASSDFHKNISDP